MKNSFNSVFQARNASITTFNWDDITEEYDLKKPEPEPEKVIEYDYDPLAMVIEAINQGKSLTEITGFLINENPAYNSWLEDFKSIKISEDSKTKSKDIRSYFKNKLVLRRLKKLHMSKYMNELERLLETENTLPVTLSRILVKLPDFYREGKETEMIFKSHISLAKNSNTEQYDHIDDIFTYAGRVFRKAKGEIKTRFYFANGNKNLLLIEANQLDTSDKLLSYIVSQNRPIGIKGIVTKRSQPGYDDFILYQNGNYEFYEPNS